MAPNCVGILRLFLLIMTSLYIFICFFFFLHLLNPCLKSDQMLRIYIKCIHLKLNTDSPIPKLRFYFYDNSCKISLRNIVALPLPPPPPFFPPTNIILLNTSNSMVLVTCLLTLTFLLSQSSSQEEREVIASDLAQLGRRLQLEPERSEVAMYPVAGQLSYLGQVISDNVTRTEPQCSQVTNVAFVKTHKAGSSTVANILQRFGITRNLTFALPNRKYRSYGYNYISRAGDILTPSRLIPLKNGSHEGYNILYNHAIYNRTAFRLFMPHNTHYISILREPFSQFISAFEYYKLQKIFAKYEPSILSVKNPISSYLQSPYKYEKRLTYFSYIKNKQSEDLGLGWNEYFIPSKLTKYLDTLKKDFSLVMFMEFFDESLLLLKRKLCWELKDILYIPKNMNQHKPERNFTELDHKRHQRLSHMDYKLYGYFLKEFKAELQGQPQDFYEELAYFKDLVKKVHHSCTSGTSFYTAETRWHDGFEVTHEDCRLMLISELAGLDILLERAGAFDWGKGHEKGKGRAGVQSAVVAQGRVQGHSGEQVAVQGRGGIQVGAAVDRAPQAAPGAQMNGLGAAQVGIQGQELARIESGVKVQAVGLEGGGAEIIETN